MPDFINELILKRKQGGTILFEYAISRIAWFGKNGTYTSTVKNFLNLGLRMMRCKIKLLDWNWQRNFMTKRRLWNTILPLGYPYLYQSKPDKATYHFNEAQKIAEKEEHRDYLWNIYYGKGLLQLMLGNVEEGTNNYRKMWEVMKSIQFKAHQAICIVHFSGPFFPNRLPYRIGHLYWGTFLNSTRKFIQTLLPTTCPSKYFWERPTLQPSRL